MSGHASSTAGEPQFSQCCWKDKEKKTLALPSINYWYLLILDHVEIELLLYTLAGLVVQ